MIRLILLFLGKVLVVDVANGALSVLARNPMSAAVEATADSQRLWVAMANVADASAVTVASVDARNAALFPAAFTRLVNVIHVADFVASDIAKEKLGLAAFGATLGTPSVDQIGIVWWDLASGEGTVWRFLNGVMFIVALKSGVV